MEDAGESTFHIYYRMRNSYRDHIVKDDETLCDFTVDTPDVELLKPVSDVSELEWAILLGKYTDLCDGCLESAVLYDAIPDSVPASPEYICPVCEKEADRVEFMSGVVSIHHMPDKPSSFPPSWKTHHQPRELFDRWRMNPEEPYTYSNLKEFIDNHPRTFRPEEYRRAKLEEELVNR